MNVTASEPQLAAPGAGLPFLETKLAHLLLRVKTWTSSRTDLGAEIMRERDEALSLARGCTPDAAATRVLITRLPGIEDSSRYWSMWMTLDHMRIVNFAIATVIRSLGEGRVLERRASTADVKPNPEADGRVAEEFRSSCHLVVDAGTAFPTLKTKLRYAHPWFGPLDAFSWYTLAAFHQGLHRRQIEKILAGLSHSSR